jgi:hypothetical protein
MNNNEFPPMVGGPQFAVAPQETVDAGVEIGRDSIFVEPKTPTLCCWYHLKTTSRPFSQSL